MKIQVDIERLVLEGLSLDRKEASRVQVAVQETLTQLFSERGMNTVSGGVYESRIAPPVAFNTHSSSKALGRQIAHSIHGSLAGSEKGGR